MVEVAVAGLRGRAWVMQILTCGDFSHKKSISNIVESRYLVQPQLLASVCSVKECEQ